MGVFSDNLEIAESVVLGEFRLVVRTLELKPRKLPKNITLNPLNVESFAGGISW